MTLRHPEPLRSRDRRRIARALPRRWKSPRLPSFPVPVSYQEPTSPALRIIRSSTRRTPSTARAPYWSRTVRRSTPICRMAQCRRWHPSRSARSARPAAGGSSTTRRASCWCIPISGMSRIRWSSFQRVRNRQQQREPAEGREHRNRGFALLPVDRPALHGRNVQRLDPPGRDHSLNFVLRQALPDAQLVRWRRQQPGVRRNCPLCIRRRRF